MTWVCTWDKAKFSHLHNIFYVARYFTGAVLLLVKAETKLSLVARSLQHSSLSVWHSAHTVSDKHYSRSGNKPKQTTWIQQLWTYQLKGWEVRTRVVYPTIKCGEWPWNAQKMKKKWYTPFYQSAQISKLLNFLQLLKRILRVFSFQGGRGLDHFASEPFSYEVEYHCVYWIWVVFFPLEY